MNFLLSWQQTWQTLGWTMLYFLAAGTVVLLVGGALRIALRRANPSARYATSLAGFAILAVLPVFIAGYLIASRVVPTPSEFVTTNLTNHTNPELNAEVAELAKVAETDLVATESTEKISENRVAATSSTPFDFQRLLNQSVDYLPWVWLVGTPLTFLLLASGLIGSERLRCSCQILTEGPIQQSCEQLRAAFGIGRQVGVAICDRVATPLLIGIVRPLILLPPAALNGWTTAELEMVLLHELAHVRRWDNAVNLAQRIVESLLFFHPAVWIASNWVRRDREDCCDAVVVGHTAKPQAYAELLVALASSQPLAGLATTALARHPLTARIRRILKLEDEPMLISRKGLMVGVSVAVAAALLAIALPTSDAEEPATRDSKFSREAERVADERASTEETTNDANQVLATEDNATTGAMIEIPTDKATDLVWQSAQTALIKSDSVLSRVVEDQNVQSLPLIQNAKPSPIEWLQKQIQINYAGGKLFISITGKRVDKKQLSTITEAIIGSYAKERDWSHVVWAEPLPLQGIQRETNTPSLASPHVSQSQPEASATGSTTNPTRQRGVEQTTNPTNDTKEGLNAKSAKSAEDAEKNPLFPTLEDQRAADVAYKLLGVELEKLTPEELERVKAKGYAGGLTVAGPIIYGAEDRVTPFRAGDLLVGLHVWPTESLDQVQEILSRDDLDQLSPLKFYVIRRGRSGGGGGRGGPPTGEGHVVTGRVSVDLDAWRAMRDRSKLEQPDRPLAQRRKEAQARFDALQAKAQELNTLLYDGKTFDEWRSLWKTELKTEKRIECINALAAFGRAGKGKEAAEAILDVAGEYHFGIISDGSAGDLKQAITQVMGGIEGVPGQYWLPLLIERLKTDPDKWSSFAWWVLSDVQGKGVTAYLKQLAKDDSISADARGAAVAGLANQPDIAEDAEAVTMVREALQGDKPVMHVFNKLRFNRLDLIPEQFELLFHKDAQIRNTALNMVRGGGGDIGPVINKLLVMLDDPTRNRDHEKAIIALYRLNGYFINIPERRRPVNDKITEILINGDTELLPASLGLMSTLSAKVPAIVIRELGDKITDERRKELESAIEKAESLKSERGFGGGGMGGGGMF